MCIKDLFRKITEKTNIGEDIVFATVISQEGSSPRRAGAHIVVGKEGLLCGSIGGGNVEYKATKTAQDILIEKESFSPSMRKKYLLKEDLGMFCGGSYEIFFQYIASKDMQTRLFLEKVIKYLDEKNEDTWFFIELTDIKNWNVIFYGESFFLGEIKPDDNLLKILCEEKASLHKIENRIFYSEKINSKEKVFIFGAGHVARALEPILSSVNFKIVIFDDRKDALHRDFFPNADSLILGNFNCIKENIKTTIRDYIIIMTYNYDPIVLRQLISGDYAYLGLMGSKTKIETYKKKFLEEGIDEKLFDKIKTPIGLNINSETPEEIAISITAELIKHRNERRR